MFFGLEKGIGDVMGIVQDVSGNNKDVDLRPLS